MAVAFLGEVEMLGTVIFVQRYFSILIDVRHNVLRFSPCSPRDDVNWCLH